MSQQLRQLRGRIRSIEGTWKITRAMEMVAMSKFKAVEGPLNMSRGYFQKLDPIVCNLIASQEDSLLHPFIRKSQTNAVGLFVVTSDAGLCGSYNDNVISIAEKFMEAQQGRDIKLYLFGRKAVGHFGKRGIRSEHAFNAIHGRLKADFHEQVLTYLVQEFSQGSVGEIHVAYTVFENAMRSRPVVAKLLHIDRPAASSLNFQVESGTRGIVHDVIPMYVSAKLRLMMLESFTSEYSSRMVAMKAAKDNAKELMGDLILLRNKMRQTMITKEVIEIISSAEALKG